jgi:hypothetical protein
MGGTHVVHAAEGLPFREHVTIFLLGTRQQ